jgi:hypothetical protein
MARGRRKGGLKYSDELDGSERASAGDGTATGRRVNARERTLQRANAEDKRIEDRGSGEDEDLDSKDNYTRGCMREKEEEQTTCRGKHSLYTCVLTLILIPTQLTRHTSLTQQNTITFLGAEVCAVIIPSVSGMGQGKQLPHQAVSMRQ